MAETILYDKNEQIVTITLNRPEALNAINRQLKQEFIDALLRFDGDDDARVAIVTGAGRAFCAGRDLKERRSDNAAGVQARATDSLGSESLSMFPRISKPLIAAINGYAMAGGWAIAQTCDLRLAADDASLGITESRWSLLPPFATHLARLIPMANVLELVFTAEPISAERAREIGFVNKVVPGDQLMSEALSLARRMTRNAPLSLRMFKELAYRGQGMGEPEIAALTRSMYDRLLVSEDAKEGPRAFAEKRAPQWHGR